MRQRDDLTGQTFGNLTAISFIRVDAGRNARWLCRCACGNIHESLAYNLKNGNVTSCGCITSMIMSVKALKHGHSVSSETKSPTYISYNHMRDRCENKNHKAYKNYGGRGIIVCERWKDFKNFLKDMGERPPGTTLDRIDNEGNYEPGNCRWADWITQANNRRKREG